MKVNDVPRLEIYLTSAENSYGITDSFWGNGEVFLSLFTKNTKYQHLIFREKRYISHKYKSNCTSETYYKCYAREFLKSDIFKACNATCSTQTLEIIAEDNMTIPEMCEKDSKEEKCVRTRINLISANWRKKNICPQKKCTIEEYVGIMAYEEFSDNVTYKKGFGYNFQPPQVVVVYEEYLIYDFVGMLGATGGMLGLFVGFSFSGEHFLLTFP